MRLGLTFKRLGLTFIFNSYCQFKDTYLGQHINFDKGLTKLFTVLLICGYKKKEVELKFKMIVKYFGKCILILILFVRESLPKLQKYPPLQHLEPLF